MPYSKKQRRQMLRTGMHFACWGAWRELKDRTFTIYYLIDATDQESASQWVKRFSERMRKRNLLVLLASGGPFFLMFLSVMLWGSIHTPWTLPVWAWVLAGCATLSAVFGLLYVKTVDWFVEMMRHQSCIVEQKRNQRDPDHLHEEDRDFLQKLFGNSVIVEENDNEDGDE